MYARSTAVAGESRGLARSRHLGFRCGQRPHAEVPGLGGVGFRGRVTLETGDALMIRSTLLRIPLLTALVGALSAAPRPQPMVTFRSSFAGVAADRQHCTWEGTVDWKAGTLRLGGAVADGWLAGSWVEVDGRIVNGDLVGSLSIIPAVAHR